jgi:hypothetical protein
MTFLRRLPPLALAAVLVVPGATAAQDETAEPTAAVVEDVKDVEDARVAELRALVPEQLAGIPLREELQIATGEQLAGQMSDDEHAVFEAMLAEQGRSLADYVAANVYLPITDAQAVVVQAHRVDGIDASETIEGWIDILALNAERPRRVAASVAGREVVLVSDDAHPDFPPLTMFAAADVVWMVVSENEALVEEAVRALSAASDSLELEE